MMKRSVRALLRTMPRRRRRLVRDKLLRFECLEERATPAGLVAAYSFDLGTGSTVTDVSGFGNHGVALNTTWSTSGKYGGALSFNGVNARVDVSDSASLRLTTGMTLEAWVSPTAVNIEWRDVIYKGNDNYYLEATSTSGGRPATAAIVGGAKAQVFGAAALPLNTWTHLAATYDGSAIRLYVNGTLITSTPGTGTITTSSFPLQIGGDSIFGQYFAGLIDDVRVYDRALSATEIQADKNTPVAPASDTEPPEVSLLMPGDGAAVSHVVVISAAATDNQGISEVEFFVDGASIGTDSFAPYSANWDSTVFSNSTHVVMAVARDFSGNETTSDPVNVTTVNPAFVNEIVVPDIFDATTIAFLPDGRMLVGELTNKILVVQPGANQPDPQPLVDLGYSYQFGEQGLMDIAVDPDFSQNGYFYVYYTKGFPGQQNHNRLSRFTMSGNSVVPGSESVLWQDDLVANSEHHGGAIAFGLDGKLYFTTGEEFDPPLSQQLDNYRGKVLRINPDGTIPLDNPFYDDNGPNKDAIWAYGLRNPFRMSIDPVTGNMYIGDVGGNDNGTAVEEINLGVRGANYGWPQSEGETGIPGITNPIFSYAHNGRDASITGGFVYRGSQFPSEYYGSYFFGDYVQNTIRRLTFDAQGNVKDVVDFWPADGSLDQLLPGDVVKLVVGPDGSLYYVDLGFNDAHVPNEAAIRRIRYVVGNLPPVITVSADPTSGLPPLTVDFSSVGTFDPENSELSYLWDFGDGLTSTEANPTHTYVAPGPYAATLTVSDGVNSTLSGNLEISVGTRPMPTILGPVDGSFFRAGDIIAFSGSATDAEDGDLAASAFTWEIRFHHEGHIHPAGILNNTTSGTLTIPTSGHDFQGATSYEIVLIVTDSTGLSESTSVTVYPDKVNLAFDSAPSGLTVSIDGINRQTPFVLDDLIGFQHTITAPNQSSGGVDYTFLGWTDGGAQSHSIVVPSTGQSYVAIFAPTSIDLPGDYNSDQTVNATDYAVWRDRLGSSVILPNDTTPGTVTQADYDVWKANFGASVPASGEAAVGGATAGNFVITAAVPTGPLDAASPVQFSLQQHLTATAVDSTNGGKQRASRLADFVMLNQFRPRPINSWGSRDLSLIWETWDALLLTHLRHPVATTNGEMQASGATIARHTESQFDREYFNALDNVFAAMAPNWVSRLVGTSLVACRQVMSLDGTPAKLIS